MALLGGDTFGCGNTGCPPASNQNLVDRFESVGLTWKGYIEDQNVASGCDTSYHEPYTPEHNPFVTFTDILNNPARCSKVVLANPSSCTVTDCSLINDLNSASAPNFMWLTPNNCDNMHGFTGVCPESIPMGDSYLKGLVPNILKSYTFTNTRAALFIVFDEGTGWCPLNGSSEDCVYAVWAGPLAKTGFATSNLYNHYSWTRTIEVNWNLASLTSNDANAKPMTEFFKTNTPPSLTTSFTYSPSSPQVGQSVTFTAATSGGTAPFTFSWSFGDGTNGNAATTAHTYLKAGSYTVSLTTKDSGTPQQTATAQQSLTVTNSPPPMLTASFSYSPSSPQKGQQITFAASASGGTPAYSFRWNFGDSSTGTGASVTHTYSSAGTFVVILTVRDNGAPQQTATSQQSVTVTNSPPPPLTVSFTYSPTSPQSGQQIAFSASVSGGTSPYSFSWNFGDSQTATGTTVNRGYSTTGTFSVILTVKDAGIPQQTSTSQHSITVTNPPTLTASFTYSPSSPQAGQLVTFTASAGGGTAPYAYSWTLGDGSTATGSTETHTYSSSGTFNVVLNVKDSGSTQQTTTSQQSLTVATPPPALTASFGYSPTSAHEGQTITFTGSASGGTAPYTYAWSFGDSSTGSGSSTTHAYQAAGSYSVVLNVKDSSGQTTTATRTVTVSSPPPSLTANFNFSPSTPEAGQQITFSAFASGGSSPYTFNWNFGDGTTGTGSSATHAYPSAGTFTVPLTAKDSSSPQQTVTAQKSVTVSSPHAPLAANFSYSPSSPNLAQTVSFSDSTSGGTQPYSYTWNFGDGSTATGSTVDHAYSTAGTFTVVLTVKDSSSSQQTASSQKSLTVTSPPPPLTASFSHSPSSPQTQQAVMFTGSASGGTTPYSFSWTFGDGGAGTGSSVSHSYQSTGSYTVALTVTDSSGQKTSTSQTVTVVSPPPPPLATSFSFNPSSPNAGQSISFTGSASGGTTPYQYSWDFGDSGTGSGSSASHTYQTGGSYTVTLTVTDAGGQVAKASHTITVNKQLSASFTYSPSSPLPLLAVTFYASASGGSSPYSYSWDFGDGTTATGASVSHSYLLPGSYTVTLTVKDANGQTVITSQSITVLTSLV